MEKNTFLPEKTSLVSFSLPPKFSGTSQTHAFITDAISITISIWKFF